MKKVIIPFSCAIALVSIASCNDSSSTTSSTDSTSLQGSANTGSSASTGETTKTSYVDLSTGASVEVRKDSTTGYYMNAQTNQPIEYYVDPSTADTFDRSGRVVNDAIAKGLDGKYMVDESKIKTADGKVKVQGDDDIKMKEGDTKIKIETDGDVKLKSGDSKEKMKGDEYKSKDEPGKTKIKDDKIKVKTN